MDYNNLGTHAWRNLLDQLRNNVMPEAFASQFSVGEDFAKTQASIEHDVQTLLGRPSILVRVIQGEYGMGKSHMLACLKDRIFGLGSDVLVSRVNFSELSPRSEANFEFLVMKGLQNAQLPNYQRVLQDTYSRLVKQIRAEEPDAPDFRVDNDVRTLLTAVISGVVLLSGGGGAVVAAPIFEVVFRTITEFIVTRLMLLIRTFRRTAVQAGVIPQQPTQLQQDFADRFIELAKRPTENSAFEGVAKQLAKEHILTDVLFRLFHKAGYKAVIILADELEAVLGMYGEDQAASVLTPLRDFHDRLTNVGRHYTSVGLLVTVTPIFMNVTIEKAEGALYSRWKRNVIELPALVPKETEPLISNLERFYRNAGYKFPYWDKEVIAEIDNAVRQKIADNKESLTFRNVIGYAIEIMDERIGGETE